jgi:DNA polymerase-3 subunit delta
LQDAVKAQSFFPGARVAFIEEATDGLAKVVTAALEDWREGDAQIVVTAGSLTPRSALRKLFEGHRNAFATAIYDDPPTREEIEADLAKAGLTGIGGDAMQELVTLSRVLDPGDFRQVIEKLALYKLGDDAPVSAQDVTDCAPATVEAALDDVLNCVAEGRKGEIGPIVRKLQGQGVMAVGICIGATRHFRALHVAASDPGGVDSGIAKARVFGPRRDRMVRQARGWGVQKLEQALQMLTETDLTLRSSAPAPQMAVMERTLIRMAMLGQR